MKEAIRIHLGLTDQFESDLQLSATIAVGKSQYPFFLVAVQKKKDIGKSSDKY